MIKIDDKHVRKELTQSVKDGRQHLRLEPVAGACQPQAPKAGDTTSLTTTTVSTFATLGIKQTLMTFYQRRRSNEAWTTEAAATARPGLLSSHGSWLTTARKANARGGPRRRLSHLLRVQRLISEQHALSRKCDKELVSCRRVSLRLI